MSADEPIRDGEGVLRHMMKLIEDGTLKPRRFGPNFDQLVETIENELIAMIAMQALGPIDPTAEQVRQLAVMVADQVDREYFVEPKVQPGESSVSSRDIHQP